jgi:hypothetical protein
VACAEPVRGAAAAGLDLRPNPHTLCRTPRDQPLATFAEPLHLNGSIDSTVRAFVRCTGDELGRDVGGDPIAPMAARARREGWLYRELVAPHDPQLTDPVGTAAVLDELIIAAPVEPDPQ